jgi:hypothetical protein
MIIKYNLPLADEVELKNHDYLIQPAASGQSIKGLDLIVLDVGGNKTITNVSFMKNLKY